MIYILPRFEKRLLIEEYIKASKEVPEKHEGRFQKPFRHPVIKLMAI